MFAALLLCLRLAFRRSGAVRSGPIDRSTPLGRALQTGAALSHALLYVLLAAIPALGWAMTSARGRDVALLPGTPALPHLVATDPDLAEVLRNRSMMVQRIGIAVDPAQAGISIADRDGNDRIVMRVSDTGEPEILVLDANGKEVARIPERKEKP